MHQMQWQGHTECPSPSLSNPTKATNAREENERKNKKDVGERNDTYGITGIPSTVGGRRVVQRAGLTGSTRIVYPGSGREDA